MVCILLYHTDSCAEFKGTATVHNTHVIHMHLEVLQLPLCYIVLCYPHFSGAITVYVFYSARYMYSTGQLQGIKHLRFTHSRRACGKCAHISHAKQTRSKRDLHVKQHVYWKRILPFLTCRLCNPCEGYIISTAACLLHLVLEI